MKKLRIAVIGCGQISKAYGEHILRYPDILEIAGATDLKQDSATSFCSTFGGRVYNDFEEILADDSVDTVLNLTVHHAHYDLNKRALEAGKHVFSEKPMALSYKDACELIAVAERHGRYLGAAPITFMGEGIQTAAKFLEKDLLGPLRLVYVEVNWGQIERWIGCAPPYFTVGPLLDVGVYAITALTYLMGPVRRVWGYSTILKNPRRDKHGSEFPVTAPDFTTGIMELANGVVARITTNYYVNTRGQKHLRGLEFHGDDASFWIDDYHGFNPICRFTPYGEEGVEVPLLRKNELFVDRALGLADMARAQAEGRQLRNSPQHAAHVIEIMEGLQKSADNGGFVDIASDFPRVGIMEWAEKAVLNFDKKDS